MLIELRHKYHEEGLGLEREEMEMNNYTKTRVIYLLDKPHPLKRCKLNVYLPCRNNEPNW
jgi:hypothetical protein